MRQDNRKPNQLRPIKITPNFTQHAEGSVLIEAGLTRVLCTASIDNHIPKWMQEEKKNDQGWVTAEYGMLPRSTHTRMKREKAASSGRTHEISRLIGRSLRSIVDLKLMKDITITIDCDVIQADGGTRCASITGGFVALALALNKLQKSGKLKQLPLKDYVSAVSIGLSSDGSLLDLNYQEDVAIETDMNFVITGSKNLVEVQATAEKNPFTTEQLLETSNLAIEGCGELFKYQEEIIGDFFPLAKR